MRRVTQVGSGSILAAALVLAACGDVETRDDRGYTKAPLEDPGLTIVGEPTTAIGDLGEPQLPQVVEIPPPADTASGAAGG